MEEPPSITKIFDPREYLNRYYQNIEPGANREVNEFVMRKWNEYIQEVPEGETVVNFGCGPTIHANISASTKFKHIVCAEYTEANRTELQKWLQNDEDKFDWTEFFKYVAVLEGRSENDWKALEERVRSIPTDVVPCDILKDPIMEHPSQPFDAVITTFCLEETCKDYESFKSNMKKLLGLLKHGGHFFIAAQLETSYYTVKDKVITTIALSEGQLKDALREAGLNIIKSSLYTKESASEKDNSTGSCLILARKQ